MQILGIVGSLRKNSFNRQLAQIVKNELEQNVDFQILEYSDVPLFNQDLEANPDESVTRVRKLVNNADGVWFFTPEYNHFFSGVLKNLLDWLSRPSDISKTLLSGKPVAVSGITQGMSGTALSQDHLVTLLSFLNMDIMNSPRLTIPNAKNQMNNEGNIVLDSSLPYLQKQAKAFVEFISKRK